MNTFGKIFTLTTFGESHGLAIGGVLDGYPAGIAIDVDFIQQELNRRRPGQSKLTTPRKESDQVEILSGVFEGKTTGCSIGFIIRNNNQHSQDYDSLRNLYRPSHADYTYAQKYTIRDHRGGGRASARETAVRVVAGAFAKIALKQIGISITAYTQQVGCVSVPVAYTDLNFEGIEQNLVRCPHKETAKAMEELIQEVQKEGDSIGGVIACVVQGCPVGLGEPIYGKLHASLGAAMLSINAVKGFDYGAGFEGVTLKGSEQNDSFVHDSAKGVVTKTNHSGGIQGGISNGQDIYFRVVFKPIATIFKAQETVNQQKENISFTAQGRHDPCVLPRAVPIVEAMTAMVVLDHYLIAKTNKL